MKLIYKRLNSNETNNIFILIPENFKVNLLKYIKKIQIYNLFCVEINENDKISFLKYLKIKSFHFEIYQRTV